MSKLLEIFGRAITVDTANLIWHWLVALHNGDQQEDKYAGMDDLREVIEHMGNMELDKAKEKLDFYLFENPECVSGRMAAAAICLNRNNLTATIEQLQSVYLRQPSNTMALYSLGYCHERLGNEAEAIEFYQDCIKFKGHLQLPMQRMAAIYFKNQKIDKTTEQYESLVAEHPEDISAMVLLGYLYIDDRKYESAVDIFNTAIVSHPDNFHDDNESEQLRETIEQGGYEQALESVRFLMDSVGEMPDMHVKMADILSMSGHPADAIVHYENAIRIQPNYLEATIKLGTHYLKLQRYSLAAEQFNRAVEINDEIVDAYIGLAVAQQFVGQHDETYGTLSLASAIQQNSTLLFSETATLHLQAALNEKDKANNLPPDKVVLIEDVIKAHKKQIIATPKSAGIHYKFGILMMVIGDLDKAILSFENALAINPTYHRALSKLSICLCESGREKQAVERLTQGNQIPQDILELHYRTAILYCDKQKFAEALSCLDNKMHDNFTQSDTLVNIEVVLENLGLIDRALTTWDMLSQTALNITENGQ